MSTFEDSHVDAEPIAAMKPIGIAIATSLNLEDLPATDEALRRSLIRIGFSVSPVIWTSGIDWGAFSAVIIRSCWDYHLRPMEFLNWIAQLEDMGVTVLNPPELIRWNLSKTYLAELFIKGVSIPPTVWVRPDEEVDVGQICSSNRWEIAVVKPIVSAGSHDTARVTSGIVRGPVMIQEYLSAIEIGGEISLVYFGGRFSHAVRKRPRFPDFRVIPQFGGTTEPARPSPELLAFAEAAIALLPYPGVFARVDLVERDHHSIVLMELEVIEPELYLSFAPGSESALAQTISQCITSTRLEGRLY
jgi:glutathione synthase/RimK-type ligase-like ATP-grasp enzyme